MRLLRRHSCAVGSGDSCSTPSGIESDGAAWVCLHGARCELPTDLTVSKVEHVAVKLEALKIYNFAFPGATVEEDLKRELSRFYAKFPKKKDMGTKYALDSASTLYGILGIRSND